MRRSPRTQQYGDQPPGRDSVEKDPDDGAEEEHRLHDHANVVVYEGPASARKSVVLPPQKAGAG